MFTWTYWEYNPADEYHWCYVIANDTKIGFIQPVLGGGYIAYYWDDSVYEDRDWKECYRGKSWDEAKNSVENSLQKAQI